MIKCKTVFLLLFALFLLQFSAVADGLPFGPGEKIHYSVKQLGVKAGDAVLEFKGNTYLEGKKYTLIVFTAQGFNFYDEERIYLDPVSLLPQKVMRDLNIFGNKEQILEDYFAADGFVRITKVARGKTTAENISKVGGIDNIYGFIYRSRLNETIKVGQTIDMSLATQNIRFEGVSEMSFNAAGKTYQAVMYKSVPPKYTIWFDAGPQKLPLRIAGSLGLSNTVMVMTGYDAK